MVVSCNIFERAYGNKFKYLWTLLYHKHNIHVLLTDCMYGKGYDLQKTILNNVPDKTATLGQTKLSGFPRKYPGGSECKFQSPDPIFWSCTLWRNPLSADYLFLKSEDQSPELHKGRAHRSTDVLVMKWSCRELVTTENPVSLWRADHLPESFWNWDVLF